MTTPRPVGPIEAIRGPKTTEHRHADRGRAPEQALRRCDAHLCNRGGGSELVRGASPSD